jgi:hypothetical protein
MNEEMGPSEAMWTRGQVHNLSMKMETVCFSEMLVSTYEFTRSPNPEE